MLCFTPTVVVIWCPSEMFHSAVLLSHTHTHTQNIARLTLAVLTVNTAHPECPCDVQPAALPDCLQRPRVHQAVERLTGAALPTGSCRGELSFSTLDTSGKPSKHQIYIHTRAPTNNLAHTRCAACTLTHTYRWIVNKVFLSFKQFIVKITGYE